jgi:large subunit ribosomal protein L21
MYYIVEIKGKQYCVKDGDLLDVDYTGFDKDASFDDVRVLLTKKEDGTVDIGTPYIDSVNISATITDEVRGPKVTTVHYKPKSGYVKKRGHRQKYSTLKISVE